MKSYSIKDQSHFFSTLAENHVKKVLPIFSEVECNPNLLKISKSIHQIHTKQYIHLIKVVLQEEIKKGI
jgi:hypothetical protein